MTEGLARLPKEPADALTRPFMRFLRIEAVAGAVLLMSVLVTLLLANTGWSAQYLAVWDMPVGLRIGHIEMSRSLRHWVNDGLMTLFFFVIALELKREMVLGELRDLRVAALPVAAALGGMIVPAGTFLLVVGRHPGASGWGVPMSTDTAFVIGSLAVLGTRIPESVRLFLLSLAIFDDVGAVLVVAIGYSDALNWGAVVVAALGLVVVAGVARLGVRAIPVYFALGGAIWLAFDASGIHATVTGVILGLMTPARSWVSDRRLHAILDRVVAYPPGAHWSGDGAARNDLQRAEVATREALSPIERLEFALHPWVALAILPVFALANAGVPISAETFDAALVTAIVAAFVFGKPAGVVLFSLLAVKLRIGVRPVDLSWRFLTAGSFLTGIGFTMALFIAERAFAPDLQNAAKLGILCASFISALLGFLALSLVVAIDARDRSDEP